MNPPWVKKEGVSKRYWGKNVILPFLICNLFCPACRRDMSEFISWMQRNYSLVLAPFRERISRAKGCSLYTRLALPSSSLFIYLFNFCPICCPKCPKWWALALGLWPAGRESMLRNYVPTAQWHAGGNDFQSQFASSSAMLQTALVRYQLLLSQSITNLIPQSSLSLSLCYCLFLFNYSDYSRPEQNVGAAQVKIKLFQYIAPGVF